MPLSVIAALAAVSATPTPAPPPRPVVVTVPEAPPSYSRALLMRSDLPPVDFEVEVRGGGTLLWSGPMRVSGRSPASFNRQQSDAPAASCPTTGSSYGYTPPAREQLSVTLNAGRDGSETPKYQLMVTWTRPGDAAGCGDSSRTVSLNQTFAAQQREIAFSGDGGLTVSIRQH